MSVNTNAPKLEYEFPIPIKVPELTRIEMRAIASVASDVYGGFTVVLIDEPR